PCPESNELHIPRNIDVLDFTTILFHETVYSLLTLRQASRRSWRIGQRRPVEVKFFAYTDTMQEVCLRLMGKKLLVALAMEGKFASEGLQAIDGDDDMLTAMARELVENKGIGESAAAIWKSVGQLLPNPDPPPSSKVFFSSNERMDTVASGDGLSRASRNEGL